MVVATEAVVPRSLVIAVRCWLLAIGAAVFETVLAAAHALITLSLTPSEVLGQVAIRLIVFAVASWLTMQVSRGKNAARIALTVMLSILGLLSLLIAPVAWLAAGHQFTEVFRDLSGYELIFAGSRLVHVLAVITATIFMFRRSVNRYIKAGMRPAP